MNPKTKKITNLPRSKLGIAGAVFSLWAIAVYSAGLLNPLQASQDTTLKVNGVQNHVQYLTSLVITGTNGNVEFKYHQATNSVQALGALNMQNIVIEDKNAGNTVSNPSAVILGGTGNRNEGQNSVILGGSGNRNEGQNNLLVNTTDSNAISFNTAIIRGQWVSTNGKNIFVNNANNAGITGNNIFINGSSSSEHGNNVAIFGSNVTNTKSNVFIFNGNDAKFNPNLDSAFYANGKVAINGSNAVGTLHVHGGVMVQNRGADYQYIPDQPGIIALFSRDGQMGLCGYDGKSRRVPLSESARLYGLCASTDNIAGTRPQNSVSNWSMRLPQVWNQQKWKWETRKWIYGSDKKPGYFLCAEGYVPNRIDAQGKTDITCEKCETAKKGDLNCPEKAAPKPEPTPVQPPVPVQPTCLEPGTTWNGTICTGTKPLKCLPNSGTNGTFSDGVQTYNGSTWESTTLCTLNCNSGYVKKTGTDWRQYCAELRWKCWGNESGKSCVPKKKPTTYSCQWWKEAPTNCHCTAGDFICHERCLSTPTPIYSCSHLSEYECKGSVGQMRWCSWEPNLRSSSARSSLCEFHTSETSCNNDSMCTRGFDEFSASLSADSDVCMEWDTIVDDAICKENNIANPCIYDYKPPKVCLSTEHLENGACVSNTKTVSCDARWVVSPANGKVNNTEQVSVTRSEATQSWSKPAKCDVTCNAGYEKRANQCVRKLKWRFVEEWWSECGSWEYTYEREEILSECDTTSPTKAPQKLWERIDAWMYSERGTCVQSHWFGPTVWGGYDAACYREAVEDK